MRFVSRQALLVVSALSLAACGSDGARGGPDEAAPATKPDAGARTEPEEDARPKELTGVWTVTGTDARGSYHGKAEVREANGVLQFIRSIAYDTVKVEDGRTLHWTFTGVANGSPALELSLDVRLDNRGFIAKRGELERKLADEPVRITGKVSLGDYEATATYSGPGVDGTETWKPRTPNGAEPIFAVNRFVEIAHDPPDGTTKQALSVAYSSFRDLPDVAPYGARPEFQAAIHGHIVDTTDFDFYRANPDALRVVNKLVDPISLQESLARANAYRKTLAAKAAGFDAEIESEFLEPTTGMLLDGAPAGEPRTVHFSAALWTGVYLASQAFRFEVTSDPKAKDNVRRTLDGILKLQEVTGDWTTFARAIRPATGDTTNGWHAGAGALSSLEWLEGGNNDMLKGLYLAYTFGHRLLCTSGSDPLCDRIRTNARHLADDVDVRQGSDDLDSPWLTAVVTTDPAKRLEYQGKALVGWTKNKIAFENNTTLYVQGTADWSGLNLGFVGNVYRMALAEQMDLNGDAKSTLKSVIGKTFDNLKRQRLPLWNLLAAVYSGQPADTTAEADTLWRLREMPFPKPTHVVDHRISPEFCMSPYPSLPWKNDWTTTDRTQALRSVPLFEDAMDIYRFRTEMKYRGDSAARPPAPEYLVAYWFARKHGLLPSTE